MVWGGSSMEKYRQKNTIFNPVKRAPVQVVGDSVKDFTEVHVNIHNFSIIH